MPAASLENRLLISTSYPDSLLLRFETAFERAHPHTDVQFLRQNGQEALPALQAEGQGGVDLYWAPSPHNFLVLRDERKLRPLALDRSALPGRLKDRTLSDPDGYFEAFEIAGFGLIVNPAYLTARGLPLPTDWPDLANPAYAGHIVLPQADRVGFAPALIDVLLQAQGWEAGWRLLQQIAATAHLSSHGPGISQAVAEGRSGIGLTVDFQALIAIGDGKPVSMVYPRHTGWSPAHVAITAQAPHPQAAKAFVDFILSDAGQKLLFHPDIRRHPVRPSAYIDAPTERNPFTADGDFAYMPRAGSDRRAMILRLFDCLITRSRAELTKSLAIIDEARAAAQRSQRRQLIAQVEASLQLATVSPATETSPLTKEPAEIAAWDQAIARQRSLARDQAQAILAAALR